MKIWEIDEDIYDTLSKEQQELCDFLNKADYEGDYLEVIWNWPSMVPTKLRDLSVAVIDSFKTFVNEIDNYAKELDIEL
jgi:hypothetical protein